MRIKLYNKGIKVPRKGWPHRRSSIIWEGVGGKVEGEREKKKKTLGTVGNVFSQLHLKN